jgi:carbon monoxide dehydrogenase subunit G
MGMEITKSFVVKAPAAAVWEFLIDPYRVGRCLPGAAITEKVDDETYTGTITIKVGPVTASYRGKLRFDRLDPVAMEAELSASGQETKGKGGADMRMKSRVVARGPAETEVTVVSDVNVMGVLAQFGRGMIQDVSDQLFQKFTDGMRRELEAPPAVAAPAAVETAAPGAPAPVGPPPVTAPAPPPPASEDVLDVGSLGAKAAGRAAGRMLRGPVFWIAVIVLTLLVYWLTHR